MDRWESGGEVVSEGGGSGGGIGRGESGEPE